MTLDRMADLSRIADEASAEFNAELAAQGIVWVTQVRVSFEATPDGQNVRVRLDAMAGKPANVVPDKPVQASVGRRLRRTITRSKESP